MSIGRPDIWASYHMRVISYARQMNWASDHTARHTGRLSARLPARLSARLPGAQGAWAPGRLPLSRAEQSSRYTPEAKLQERAGQLPPPACSVCYNSPNTSSSAAVIAATASAFTAFFTRFCAFFIGAVTTPCLISVCSDTLLPPAPSARAA